MRVTETRTYCEICKKEDCDGKEYIVPAREQCAVKFPEKRVCSSQVKIVGGKAIYTSQAGIGMYFDYAAYPVDEEEGR